MPKLGIPCGNLAFGWQKELGEAVDCTFYEKALAERGYRYIAGVDEAGRGPLAGPVVAAAVILDPTKELQGVTDSKAMSLSARERAFPLIREAAVSASIAVIPHSYIDRVNILQAALEAMRRSVLELDVMPDFILVDGNQKVPVPVPQTCLKKGDRLSLSISAASVLAKVYRDRLMNSYHAVFPGYGFNRHKGYGTKEHMEALRRLGPSPIHRMTFRGVKYHDQAEDCIREIW